MPWWALLLLPATAALTYKCENEQVLVVQSFGNDTIRMHCQKLDLCGYKNLKCEYDNMQPHCGGKMNFVAHVNQKTPTGLVEHSCCQLYNPRPPNHVPTHEGNDCFIYELPDGSTHPVDTELEPVSSYNAEDKPLTVLKSAADIPSQIDGYSGYRLRLFLLRNKSPPTLLVKGIERRIDGYRVTICRPRCSGVHADGKSQGEWQAVSWSSWSSSSWSSWAKSVWGNAAHEAEAAAAAKRVRSREQVIEPGTPGVSASATAEANAKAEAEAKAKAGVGAEAKFEGNAISPSGYESSSNGTGMPESGEHKGNKDADKNATIHIHIHSKEEEDAADNSYEQGKQVVLGGQNGGDGSTKTPSTQTSEAYSATAATKSPTFTSDSGEHPSEVDVEKKPRVVSGRQGPKEEYESNSNNGASGGGEGVSPSPFKQIEEEENGRKSNKDFSTELTSAKSDGDGDSKNEGKDDKLQPAGKGATTKKPTIDDKKKPKPNPRNTHENEAKAAGSNGDDDDYDDDDDDGDYDDDGEDDELDDASTSAVGNGHGAATRSKKLSYASSELGDVIIQLLSKRRKYKYGNGFRKPVQKPKIFKRPGRLEERRRRKQAAKQRALQRREELAERRRLQQEHNKGRFRTVSARAEADSAPKDAAVQAAAPAAAGAKAAGARNCFPADAIVTTPLGPKRMDELQIGDRVLVPSGGGRKLAVTPLHLLPIGSCEEMRAFLNQVRHTLRVAYCGQSDGVDSALRSSRFARRGQIGDCVLAVHDDGQIEAEQIVRIGRKISTGIYSPITVEGGIIADGVLASCFAQVESHATHKILYDFTHWVYRALSLSSSATWSEVLPLPRVVHYMHMLSHYAVPFAKY